MTTLATFYVLLSFVCLTLLIYVGFKELASRINVIKGRLDSLSVIVRAMMSEYRRRLGNPRTGEEDDEES